MLIIGIRHVFRMGDPVEDQRAWLEAAVAASGLSATALARKAGVAQTTVTRLLYNREPVHALNAHSLSAIERASGVPFGIKAPSRPRGFNEGEAEPYRAENFPADLQMAVAGLLSRGNGVDPWVLRSRALETANFIPNDILVVDLNATALAGDVVCAQIYDWQRGKAETVFRLYEPPFLIAQTNELALRKPMLVDDEKIVIKGVVQMTIRPRTRRDAA